MFRLWGGHSLLNALSKEIENVIVMQVVPNMTSSLPIVNEYLSVLGEFDSSLEANTVSLEGFIIAKIFHQGLLQVKGDITKESIIDGIESLNGIDIGLGLDIYFNKSEHQAIHKLWLTKLNSGLFEDFNWKMMPDENMKGKKHE